MPTRRLLALASVTAVLAACGGQSSPDPPVATPAFAVKPQEAALGSPIDIAYQFDVAPDVSFDRDHRVMVHFLDSDRTLMWTDDHDPPVPTSQWKPGQRIEYSRTIFVPIYPYIGQATVEMGLYSAADERRLRLIGRDSGQRAYEVGSIRLLPQSENVFLIYGEGWHPAEMAEDNPAVEWQWTKKQATITFRNPKGDATVYLDLDGRPDAFESPQQVTIRLGEETVDQFALDTTDRVLRRISVTAVQLGTEDLAELTIEVDRTFVPARGPGGPNDPRELGVRVFHAFVAPRF